MDPFRINPDSINVKDLLVDVVLKDNEPIVLGPMSWSGLFEFMFSLEPGTTVSTQHRNESGLWGTTFIKLHAGFGEYLDQDCVTRCRSETYSSDTMFETVAYIPIES